MVVDFERVKETFQFLGDWEPRYEFIVELGTKLPPMDESLKTDATRVHECMSMVWIKVVPDSEDANRFVLHGDCDTSTVKGLVAILVSLYQGKTADEILDLDVDQAFRELGLFDHLSPTRHVGVYAMVRHIQAQVRTCREQPASAFIN